MVADAVAIEHATSFTPVLTDERRDFRGSFSGYERDHLFYNTNGAADAFVPSAYVFGLDYDHDGRAASPVDIDGDGDLDLALLTLRGLRLLENTTDERPLDGRHYARLRLEATGSFSSTLRATVTAEAGGVTHRDYSRITEGFQTQVPRDLHIGLGNAETIDRLEVQWPSGTRDVWVDLPVDRLLRVTEGATDVTVEQLNRWSDGTRPKAIGVPSTAVDAPQLDGPLAPLADGQRPAVVNFWAPWCAPCNVELPQLVSLAETYDGRVDFVGVSVERSDLASVRETIQEFSIPYPQFLADDRVMDRFFGGGDEAALPSTYVFDQHGRLRRLFRGPITEADLDVLLQSFEDEGVSAADLELAARAAQRLGDYEKAIEHYRRLAEMSPTSAQPLYQIGVAALELGEVEEAREALEQAVNRAPTNAMAQFRLGVARLRLGQAGDAFANLRAALELAGRDPELLRSLGQAAAAAGQLWLAGDAFTRAVEIDPTSAMTWVEKGRIHLARGQRPPARDAFARALEIDSDNEAARAGFKQLGAGGP